MPWQEPCRSNEITASTERRKAKHGGGFSAGRVSQDRYTHNLCSILFSPQGEPRSLE